MRVSRETTEHQAPPAPPEARGVFGSAALPLAERYAALLASEGVVRGLMGPREAPRLWQRHLLNCAVLAETLPDGARVCDIGSGAGLPGLVLAVARPDCRVTLLEPLWRRTTFLSEVVAELGLENVEVDRGRAEERHGTVSYDVVTSRAVAPLERLLRWSMPLVAPEGALVAMKGSTVAEEVERAAPVLTELGCAPPEVLTLGGDVLADPTWAVRVVHADPGQVSLPSAATPRDGLVPGPRKGSASGRRRTRRPRQRR